jgi:hypothetical protein
MRLPSLIVSSVCVAVLTLAGCSSGTSASVSSAGSPTASSASASASPSTASSAVGVSSQVRAALVTAIFSKACSTANFGSLSDALVASIDESAGACNLSESPAGVLTYMKGACAGFNTKPLVATFDAKANRCALTGSAGLSAASLKTQCDQAASSEDIKKLWSVTSDATSCLLTYIPGSVPALICESAKSSKDQTYLHADLIQSTATCSLSLDMAYFDQLFNKAIAEGTITCADGSPKDNPSDTCIIELLKQAASDTSASDGPSQSAG